MSDDRQDEGIWLEVSNVRIDGSGKVSVQLRGDKADKEPIWWSVVIEGGDDAEKLYRRIAESLDKKRIALASLRPDGDLLKVKYVRIQFSDSDTR